MLRTAPGPLADGRAPVILFVVLTFAISWGAWIAVAMNGRDRLEGGNVVLYLIGGFGPAIAAALMRFAIQRRPVPSIPGAMRRPVWLWMPLALGLSAGPVLVGILVGLPFGEGPVAGETAAVVASFGGPLLALVVLLIAGPLSEEPGWRGYAHPRIRNPLSRIQTAVALGTIWAAWHLPLFFIAGTSQNESGFLSIGFGYFVISCLPQTYLLGHVYERGGVAAAVLWHFAYNATATVLQVSQTVENAAALVLFFAAAIALELRQRITDRARPVSSAAGARLNP